MSEEYVKGYEGEPRRKCVKFVTEDYLNADLPLEVRIDDLIGRLTLDEKISQMLHTSPAIDRLGIPAYNWWNECLHGVAMSGRATVFPQAIGMAASFNAPLLHRIASAIADEGRAKYHAALAEHGKTGMGQGLTYFSPNINIFRDPRWGRGQETYGECPYLTARMAVAFVKGLQGDDLNYLKLVATPKHFAVHSGPEALRHEFDARVCPRDLEETYLPAFEACVREAGAASVMAAYNRTNGEPCVASHTLLEEILRERWGFDGCIVSDCGGVADLHQHHKVTSTPCESAALAVKNGCDLDCGWSTYLHLSTALDQELIDEATIDKSLRRLLRARFRLGMFDPPQRVPYAQISADVVGCDAYRTLARQIACESIVMLKNEGNLLPLSRNISHILVTGPTAHSLPALWGNYNGFNGRMTTILEGITDAVAPGTAIHYIPGCELTGGAADPQPVLDYAKTVADVVVAVMGLTDQIEGEESTVSGAGGDRPDLFLPAGQQKLLEALQEAGKPVVLILTGGSALAVEWAKQNLPAILLAWYPGQEGGNAVADVLFGDYNPAGRLPVTFYKSHAQLPPFEDYSMLGRTYRYFEGETLWPFGYGLSYSTFVYSDLQVEPQRVSVRGDISVSAEVTNTGACAGDEVVQVYLSHPHAGVPTPKRQLAGFSRIHLGPGESRRCRFTITVDQMSLIDDQGHRIHQPGRIQISIGGGQPVPPTPTSQYVLAGVERVA